MSASTASHRRGDPPPLGGTLITLSAMVLLTGSAVLGASLYAAGVEPPSRRTAVVWGTGALAVVLSGCATAAAYGLSAARHHRDRRAAGDAEAVRLAEQTLPELVARLRAGASVETALAALPAPAHPAYATVVATFADEVGRSERLRVAAMSACANAAGRIQALTTGMLADLREMEHRHGEEVLGDLLHLDHRTAQAGRIADSIAVLTGARTGRRWTRPIAMEAILRGAMGRISAYQRVRLHSTSTVAVRAHAAEGVMHALAEVMDNATAFSPPTSEVHVYVEEVSAGVVVSVEDGGLVMSDDALARGRRAVSAEPLDLTILSGTRLGLAVVGCLGRKYGLRVSFRPSSRGGTGVVMVIPQSIVTQSGESVPGGGQRRGTVPAAPAPAEPRSQVQRPPESGYRMPEQRTAPAPGAAGTGEWSIPAVSRWPGPDEDSWGRPLPLDGRPLPPPTPPAPGHTWGARTHAHSGAGSGAGSGSGAGPDAQPVPFSAYGGTPNAGTPDPSVDSNPDFNPNANPYSYPYPNSYRAEGPEHAYGAAEQGSETGLPRRRHRALRPTDPGTPARAARAADRRLPEENAARFGAFHRGVHSSPAVRGTARDTARDDDTDTSQSQEGETR